MSSLSPVAFAFGFLRWLFLHLPEEAAVCHVHTPGYSSCERVAFEAAEQFSVEMLRAVAELRHNLLLESVCACAELRLVVAPEQEHSVGKIQLQSNPKMVLETLLHKP